MILVSRSVCFEFRGFIIYGLLTSEFVHLVTYPISIGVDPTTADYTPEQIYSWQRGNKDNWIGWIAYFNTLWALKGCMLFFYWRLTYVSRLLYRQITYTN